MTGKNSEPKNIAAIFLSMSDLEHVTTLGKSTIKRLMEEGDFPKPVPIAHRRMAWLRVEIENWCERRVQSYRGGDV